MPHLAPLPWDAVPQFRDRFEHYQNTRGFVPNSILTMSRRPGIAEAFMDLNRAARFFKSEHATTVAAGGFPGGVGLASHSTGESVTGQRPPGWTSPFTVRGMPPVTATCSVRTPLISFCVSLISSTAVWIVPSSLGCG